MQSFAQSVELEHKIKTLKNYFLILVLYRIQDRILLLLKELYHIQNKTFRLYFLLCRRFQEMQIY